MNNVTRTTRRSSLYHPVPAALADRQGQTAPAVRSLVDRVTPSFSGIATIATMSKTQAEFDGSNPFIPSSSPVCRLADTALVFWVALIGLSAAVIAVIRHLSAGVSC